MTIRQIIATPNAPAAIGTYSQAVRVGQTVYLSGQIPLDPVSMTIVGGNTGAGFELQVRRVFDNLQAVCEAAGGTMNHIVKVNVFLLDLANFAVLNTIFRGTLSSAGSGGGSWLATRGRSRNRGGDGVTR
jgi:reactive intermediate/imine deaminase